MSKNLRPCVICSTTFAAPPSSKKVTCSPICRSVRAKRSAMVAKRTWSIQKKSKLSEKGQTGNLKKGTPAALLSPIAGPFETNINALDWVIRSPEGMTHEFRNLNLWIREHADLLPGTPEQARAGFMQIKRSVLGKTKRPVGSWKGWTLIRWSTPES